MSLRKCLNFFCIIFLNLLLGCQSSPKQKSDPTEFSYSFPGFQKKVHQKIYPSGFQVVVVPDPKAEVVLVQLWNRMGSSSEDFGLTGVNHFLLNTPLGTKPPESHWIRQNAVNRDYTFDSLIVLKSEWHEAVKYLSQWMAPRAFSEKFLMLQKQYLYQDLKQKSSTSEFKILDQLWSMVFPAHPYRYPVMGYLVDWGRLTAQDLEDYQKKKILAGNFFLVVHGDVSLEEVKDSMEAAVPGFAAPSKELLVETKKESLAPFPAVSSPKNKQTQYKNVTPDTNLFDGQMVGVGYLATHALQTESDAFDVLVQCLFSDRTGFFKKTMEKEKHLFGTVEGLALTPREPGMFYWFGEVKKQAGSVALTLSMVQNEWARTLKYFLLNQNSASAQEKIKTAQNELAILNYDQNRSFLNWTQSLGMTLIVSKDPFRFMTDAERYNKVTLQDIKNVIEKYLAPEKASWSAVSKN